MYRLREIEEKDIEIINTWRNDKDLIDCLVSPFRYINIETDEKWFDGYMKARVGQIRLSILDDKKLIGLVYLLDIDFVSRNAHLGIMIGDANYRHKGAGSFAIKEILNHAFNNLNLERVYLQTLEYNKPAINLYEKLGFKKEGIMRQAVFKNGKYVDLYLYAILKSEFRQADSKL